MAVEHLSWAMKLHGLTPSARMVLLVLADACDPSGYTEASVGYLSERTTQSAETVAKRLLDLEGAGLIRQSGAGLRIAMGEAEPVSFTDAAERRAIRDQRIIAEMEERRASRVEHTEEEKERVRQMAEEAKRRLGGPLNPAP